MKEKLILNGQWTLTGTDEGGAPLSLPIQIPGYVIPTLVEAGFLPDVYYRENAKLCQWVEEREWRFSLTFDLPRGVDVSDACLRFESVDTLHQILHRVPRRLLFIRWGTKGVRQEIRSSNPHTRLVYADYVVIER